MKEILKYIGYIMAIGGFAYFIWRSGRTFEKLDSKVSDINGKIEVVMAGNTEIMTEQQRQAIRLDAVISNQAVLLHNQEVLKTSYMNHLAKDRLYEELIEYLKLFDFSVEKAIPDTMQFNILIRKKQ